MTMTVKKETAQIRPFVVCAILRNVTFDQDRYEALAARLEVGRRDYSQTAKICNGTSPHTTKEGIL